MQEVALQRNASKSYMTSKQGTRMLDLKRNFKWSKIQDFHSGEQGHPQLVLPWFGRQKLTFLQCNMTLPPQYSMLSNGLKVEWYGASIKRPFVWIHGGNQIKNGTNKHRLQHDRFMIIQNKTIDPGGFLPWLKDICAQISRPVACLSPLTTVHPASAIYLRCSSRRSTQNAPAAPGAWHP